MRLCQALRAEPLETYPTQDGLCNGDGSAWFVFVASIASTYILEACQLKRFWQWVNGRTGGPWGTLAHVEACLAAKVLGNTFRKAAWRTATRQVDSMLGEVLM